MDGDGHHAWDSARPDRPVRHPGGPRPVGAVPAPHRLPGEPRSRGTHARRRPAAHRSVHAGGRTGRHGVDPHTVWARQLTGHGDRRDLRRARLSSRDAERARDFRVRRALRTRSRRSRGCRRHGGLDAQPTLVRRPVRDRRIVLSGLHPVGTAGRPAPGVEHLGDRHGSTRFRRIRLEHRGIRPGGLPDLELSGGPAGRRWDAAHRAADDHRPVAAQTPPPRGAAA